MVCLFIKLGETYIFGTKYEKVKESSKIHVKLDT